MNLFILLYLINFIKTLVIILVIYYGIRLFTRYVLPLLIDKGMKNMQQKMHDQQREKQRSNRPEGDVTIENKKSQQKKDRGEGEYVDFEEVD